MIIDALWSLSNLTDNDKESLDFCLKTDIVPAVAHYITPSSILQIIIPSLRIIGNLLSDTNELTEKVIQSGIITNLFSVLDYQKASVQKEALWAISNITAGPSRHIEMVFQNSKYIEKLIQMAEISAQQVIVTESVWVLSNATSNGSKGVI